MLRRLIVAALLVVPSIAVAQRGGRTQSDRKTPLFDKEEMPKGPTLRVRDIEDQDPLKLLIDKRKDLKLSDAQLAQLKEADGKLKEQNAPLFKSLDSLLHDMRISGTPTEQEQTRARNARGGLMEAVQSVNASYDAASKTAVATLDAEQQLKANELLDKLRQDGQKAMRERLGGGQRP